MAFVELANRIAEYATKTPITAVVSETFGAYSRTLAQGKNGVLTWQEAFANEINPYRRMFTEVCV